MSPLRGEAKRPTYVILDRLSSGIGDDVFLTHHEIFDGKYVQKTVFMHGLEDALASNEPAFLNRLDHPQIVPVREAQWDPREDRAITFVMPHLAGGSVDDALREGYRFSIQQAITVTIDSLDALAYVVREFGAIHRDTKPGNVLLDERRSRGYLSDFGSTVCVDSNAEADAVLGTNIYRPPEARKTGRVGVTADLYGLGMTLFEMLNGRFAWEELDFASVERRLQSGLRSLPDSAFVFQPHVPERLQRVVRKSLQRDPAKRFRSPDEFIGALRKVVSVDWRCAAGGGAEGEWYGTWPPRLREERQFEYRVVGRRLVSGPERERVRLESDYRRPGKRGWRQAAPDATIDAGDLGAASTYFEQVAANAAHRSPPR
jgi:serine/threonine protein kinase